MPELSEEEMAKEAMKFAGFHDKSEDEQREIVKNTEAWLDSFSDDEQVELIESLRVAAGIKPETAEEMEMLQSITFAALDSMDLESDDATVQRLYGITEEGMQMYARWLDMESLRYKELNEMSNQEAWVTGMLMGIRVGIVLRETQRQATDGG